MGIREYMAAIAGLNHAEARHAGVLRGGYADEAHFYYCARGFWKVPLADVQDFRHAPYTEGR